MCFKIAWIVLLLQACQKSNHNPQQQKNNQNPPQDTQPRYKKISDFNLQARPCKEHEVHTGSKCQSQEVVKRLDKLLQSGATPPCSGLYIKGSEVARGATAVVYSVGRRMPNLVNGEKGQCWESGCSETIVKETIGISSKTDARFTKLASELDVAPAVYAQGTCIDGKNPVEFKIEERVYPATIQLIEKEPKEFEKQLWTLVNRLHEYGLTHGDVHLGNIAYKIKDGHPEYKLVDFDKALDISVLPVPTDQGHINYENMVVKDLIGGRWYPVGGWPADLKEQQIDKNYLLWQTYIYKWKKADINLDGVLNQPETNRLSDYLGSWELAQAAQFLYNKRIKNMKNTVVKGFLCDNNLDGVIEPIELKKCQISMEAIQDYQSYADNLKNRHRVLVPNGDTVRKIGGTDLVPSNILIISGGDRNERRRFPELTERHTAQFATNQGYRFEAFSGNLADGWIGYWHKIFMILDELEHPENKVVVWFDDDGVVSLSSNMIEQYLKAYPNKSLIIALDPESFAHINSGAMIFRNSIEVRTLLVEMLKIGEEERKIGHGWTYDHGPLQTLSLCTQQHLCLHEQQALVELLQQKRIIGPAWENSTPRKTTRNWYEVVQVVPQIDLITNRNMNLFTEGYIFKLKGRYDVNSDRTTEYNFSQEPFFVQCAGPQDKNICINHLLNAHKTPRWWEGGPYRF